VGNTCHLFMTKFVKKKKIKKLGVILRTKNPFKFFSADSTSNRGFDSNRGKAKFSLAQCGYT
jgi:hypothetical protein